MHYGHRITGAITDYDDKGRGCFRVEAPSGDKGGSGDFCIPFTAMGDEVTATFVKRDNKVKMCRLAELHNSGPDRVATPCPHAGTCGGCLWQHLSYDAQLKLKLALIQRTFKEVNVEECPTEVVPAKETFRYRNRMDYAVGWNSEIGLKEYGQWNRYIDLSTCLLVREGVTEIFTAVREWMKAHDLQPWDAKFYTGDIRYVVIRDGKNTNERLITLVVHSFDRITEASRADLKTRLAPHCTALLLGEQSLQTDISQAQKFEPLIGDPWLEEVANNIRYRIHPNSFFQTNTHMAELLQTTVDAFLFDTSDGTLPKHVLDLYCGLGFFGIALAARHPDIHVSGFEIDAEAIKLASYNAKVNGVADRTIFSSGPAEDLSWKDIPANAVVLDPPRAGLHPKVLKTILANPPDTIVYVSCNYHRLVHELVQLKQHYRISGIKALDLFPHTPHVEVIVKLNKKTA